MFLSLFRLNKPKDYQYVNFGNDDSNDNKGRKKKAIGLISKTTTLHVPHTFWHISLPSMHNYNMTFHYRMVH